MQTKMSDTKVPGRYNVALNKEDPADVWEFSQKSYNHVTNNGNEEEEEGVIVQPAKEVAIPTGTKNNLRSSNPDYQVGKVTTYDKERIKQYELDLRLPDDD